MFWYSMSISRARNGFVVEIYPGRPGNYKIVIEGDESKLLQFLEQILESD